MGNVSSTFSTWVKGPEITVSTWTRLELEEVVVFPIACEAEPSGICTPDGEEE